MTCITDGVSAVSATVAVLTTSFGDARVHNGAMVEIDVVRVFTGDARVGTTPAATSCVGTGTAALRLMNDAICVRMCDVRFAKKCAQSSQMLSQTMEMAREWREMKCVEGVDVGVTPGVALL